MCWGAAQPDGWGEGSEAHLVRELVDLGLQISAGGCGWARRAGQERGAIGVESANRAVSNAGILSTFPLLASPGSRWPALAAAVAAAAAAAVCSVKLRRACLGEVLADNVGHRRTFVLGPAACGRRAQATEASGSKHAVRARTRTAQRPLVSQNSGGPREEATGRGPPTLFASTRHGRRHRGERGEGTAVPPNDRPELVVRWIGMPVDVDHHPFEDR